MGRVDMKIQEMLIVVLLAVILAAGILAGQKVGDTPPVPVDWTEEWETPTIPPENIWVDPQTSLEFVWVEGGCYEMGCGPWTSQCHDDEYPVHRVCLDGFWMGRHPVTQSQWLKVWGENPSHFCRGGDYPVESVSWHQAGELAHKLSARGGEPLFRLPTEAEWEYACRSGGREEKYSGGKNPEPTAWYRRNSGYSTQPVGSRRPNGLGLFDMSGNVFEWVRDEYSEDAYERHEEHNPLWETQLGTAYAPYLSIMEKYAGVSIRRVVRGGSWESLPAAVRCSHRIGPGAGERKSGTGVRLVVERPRPAGPETDASQSGLEIIAP